MKLIKEKKNKFYKKKKYKRKHWQNKGIVESSKIFRFAR